MQQCTINHIFGNKIYGMINMETISKFDTKSVIKSDISTKLTAWIGHKAEISSLPILISDLISRRNLNADLSHYRKSLLAINQNFDKPSKTSLKSF